MKDKIRKYSTRFEINGDIIDDFNTYEEASKAIERYEKEDKLEGNYTPDYYEIYNNETKRVE